MEKGKMASRDLVYIENRDMFFCPFCQEEVNKLMVTVVGWGEVDLTTESVTVAGITETKDYECPHCGREVDFE